MLLELVVANSMMRIQCSVLKLNLNEIEMAASRKGAQCSGVRDIFGTTITSTTTTTKTLSVHYYVKMKSLECIPSRRLLDVCMCVDVFKIKTKIGPISQMKWFKSNEILNI